MSVSVCVRQPRACPRHKSSRVQARTAKFGEEVQNSLVRVPIFFFFEGGGGGGAIDIDLQLEKPNLPYIELVHAITHHLFKLEPSNLDKRCQPTCLWSLLFCRAIDCDLHGQILLVNWLIKPSLGQNRDLCYTHNRHPISVLSRTVAAWWFYCSVNPSRHRELYLLYAPPAVLAHTPLQSI